MTADALLALADALRRFALDSGRDLNASNLFVHVMLTRALAAERKRGGANVIDADALWTMVRDGGPDARAA